MTSISSEHVFSLHCCCCSSLQSSGQPDDDDITWGSDELPIENINSKFTEGWSPVTSLILSYWFCKDCNVKTLSFSDGPIVTDDELTSLPLVRVVPDGQYTSSKLNSVVRMMRGLLEQKVPLQEFEVYRLYMQYCVLTKVLLFYFAK